MDRNQPAAAASLLDQEGRIIAEILRSYRDLVNFATEPITNKTSTGQASYNSMAMDLETQNLIKSVENLLSLTRRIRELWIVGPLRKPGEGDRTEETIKSEVQKVVGILNQLRSNKRQQLVSEGGGYGQFEVGDLALPPQVNAPGAPGAPGSISAATNGAAPQTGELSMQLDEVDAAETESADKVSELTDNTMTIAALELGSLDAPTAIGETEGDDAVLPPPVDNLTKKLVQSYTAPSPEGKSLMEDFMDAMISPTDPPESFRAEMECWAEDMAADQRADDSQLHSKTDESSEFCSLTSSSLSEGEAASGGSSTDLSPQSASVTKNDDTSGEEHNGEPPLPTE